MIIIYAAIVSLVSSPFNKLLEYVILEATRLPWFASSPFVPVENAIMHAMAPVLKYFVKIKKKKAKKKDDGDTDLNEFAFLGDLAKLKVKPNGGADDETKEGDEHAHAFDSAPILAIGEGAFDRDDNKPGMGLEGDGALLTNRSVRSNQSVRSQLRGGSGKIVPAIADANSDGERASSGQNVVGVSRQSPSGTPLPTPKGSPTHTPRSIAGSAPGTPKEGSPAKPPSRQGRNEDVSPDRLSDSLPLSLPQAESELDVTNLFTGQEATIPPGTPLSSARPQNRQQ
jgi:hypothetical protein